MKQLAAFGKWLIWQLSRLFVALYVRPVFRLEREPECDPLPAAPFIMISNHGTFFDPWLVGGYSVTPLSIMMNDDAYRSGFVTRTYLRWIGTFGKKKGASDYRAMKTMLKLLGAGRPVLVFPEGQTSWDGETQPIYAGIEKIILRAGCPLVLCRLSGNFLSKPWWARSRRKGRTRLIRKVISAEELRGTPPEQLLRRITDFIHTNDIKDERNLETPFEGAALAEGLERFVWMCRQCEREDHLITEGDTISCSACGASWSMDAHCRFEPESDSIAEIGDLHDWAQWHKRRVIEKLAETDSTTILTTGERALLQTEDEHGEFVDRGHGPLALTKQTLTFTPTDGARPLELSVDRTDNYVFERKNIFECRCEDLIYRFAFDGHSPMKWVYYFRYLNNYQIHERNRYIR